MRNTVVTNRLIHQVTIVIRAHLASVTRCFPCSHSGCERVAKINIAVNVHICSIPVVRTRMKRHAVVVSAMSYWMIGHSGKVKTWLTLQTTNVPLRSKAIFPFG